GVVAERSLLRAEAPPPAPAEQTAKPVQRLRHHSGFIKLQATQPAEALDQAAALVQRAGGYVESLAGNRAVLRVPAGRFEEIYARLLTLGDVLKKSVTTQDITDQFTDVDLRLQIAEAARRRLVELLAKAKGEKEKLAILKEIERLSTQIEYLSAQRESLLKLAQFARITLEVQERTFEQGRADVRIGAFAWIADLSPFKKQVAAMGSELTLTPPAGFVGLEKKTPWSAESADGVALWASRQANIPAGDTPFWLEAVRVRLAPQFASLETLTAGDFKVLRLVARGENAFVYMIALRAQREKEKFDLVEMYFPSREHETRHGAAVLDALVKGDK
ncbi:MAG: DUF4349 domain-containing protein, partial [Desulfobacterales bacterium]|nr:DUF4349 domain-containing protein [Desulfobacterales bacterium]